MTIEETFSFDGKQFVKLIEFSKLVELQPKLIDLPSPVNKKIVLLLLNNQIIAFDDLCPHQHKPSLHLGNVENGCIVCPEHGWAFPLLEPFSGQSNVSNQRLRTYEILLKDDCVYLRFDNLNEEKWKFF